MRLVMGAGLCGRCSRFVCVFFDLILSYSQFVIYQLTRRRRRRDYCTLKMSNNRKDFPSADEVKAKSKQGKDTLVAKLREDGV